MKPLIFCHLLVTVLYRLLHGQRRAHGPHGMILLRLWRVKDGHHGVADELVQRALVFEDGPCR